MGARKTGQYRDVDELLAVLREGNCLRAKVALDAGKVVGLEVEFAPEPVSASPFVDKNGKPIDLDEGAPELARDPGGEDEDEPEPDVSADRGIERANLRRRTEKAS